MFALAMITVLEHYGALRAARVLLTPILRPLLGLPGSCGLALITSLQSTDGAAALTRQLKDAGELNEAEVNIFCQFQYSADATITNFLSSGAVCSRSPRLTASWLSPLRSACASGSSS